MKLDYTLNTPEERMELVKQILKENPQYSLLDSLVDYVLLAVSKQERKQRKILTENRLSTINKRETSYEGLALSLESGEDGIYNLIQENKNALLQPKVSITKKDQEEIPPLRQVVQEISNLEKASRSLTGRSAYLAKKMLIDLRKDQYIIKNIFRLPVQTGFSLNGKHAINLDGFVYLDASGNVQSEGISFTNPKIVTELLNNYSHLKQDSYDQFLSDTYYIMADFDSLLGETLRDLPILERIVECKIDGCQNQEIKKILETEFQTSYSIEYISSLWRKKIPRLIATQAQKNWLDWYYTFQARGNWKKCSKCGEVKLAHILYFSRNATSKDGFYSICKECRKTKKKKGDNK